MALELEGVHLDLRHLGFAIALDGFESRFWSSLWQGDSQHLHLLHQQIGMLPLLSSDHLAKLLFFEEGFRVFSQAVHRRRNGLER